VGKYKWQVNNYHHANVISSSSSFRPLPLISFESPPNLSPSVYILGPHAPFCLQPSFFKMPYFFKASLIRSLIRYPRHKLSFGPHS
jgi:hypothetical protein